MGAECDFVCKGNDIFRLDKEKGMKSGFSSLLLFFMLWKMLGI